MKPIGENIAPDPALRAAAEAQLANSQPPEISVRSNEEILHELRVHQIELEMQNEALRQVQQALEESRDRFVDLYEFAPVGYLTLTAHGMIAEINLTGVTLLGRDRGKLLNTSLRKLVIAADQNRWMQHFMAVTKRDQKTSIELSIQRGDGSVFQALLDCVSNKSGVRITLGDITERKNFESERAMQQQLLMTEHAQLIESNSRLEQSQSQLLQSEKLAAIGQLAAGVAHEINNPIGYVNSNFGVLENYLDEIFAAIDQYEAAGALQTTDDTATEELRQFKAKVDWNFIREDVKALLAESHHGLERVKKIIIDLKDFAHADSKDHWVQADVHHGLDSTLSVIWNELKYKCEVVKDYGCLPEIVCLPSQLNQVFMNLLMNAAQAIDTRGIITLRTGQVAERVWIEVSDTGNGISPENIPRLFDPFFTTKPVGKGTGLGLSISHQIIVKHHGQIMVCSDVGQGTTFRIWLPVQQPEQEKPP
jgi:PAS domain S-box-containing protein